MKDIIFERQIIYGCMGLGGSWDDNPPSSADYKQAHEVVETVIENGINWFDHADIYSHGKAEKVFGQVLKERPELREQMILQSKAGIQLGQGLKGSNHYRLDKEYLVKSVEGILQRLNTEYLDFFLIHRPDPLVHPHDIAEAYHELKKNELIRYFGVSNMSDKQVELLEHYNIPVLTNQLQFSLGHSLILEPGVTINMNDDIPYSAHGIMEWAMKNNKPLQTWGSLDQGKFTSGSDDETSLLVNGLAEKYSQSKEAIILNWLMSLPAVIQPIIGTTNKERIRNSASATEFELEREDWYNLWISARGAKLP